MRTGRKKTIQSKKKMRKRAIKSRRIKENPLTQPSQSTQLVSQFLQKIGTPLTHILLTSLKITYFLLKKPKAISFGYTHKKNSLSRLFSDFKKDHQRVLKQINPDFKTATTFFDVQTFKRLLKHKDRQKKFHQALKALRNNGLNNILVYKSKADRSSIFSKKNRKKLKAYTHKKYKLAQKWLRKYKRSISKQIQGYKKRARFLAQQLQKQRQSSTKKTTRFLVASIVEVNKKRYKYAQRLSKRLTHTQKLLSQRSQRVLASLKKRQIVQPLQGLYQGLRAILLTQIRVKFRYVVVVFVLVGFAGGSGYFYNSIIKDLPDPSQLSSISPELTTKIYDRNGILLYKIFKDQNRSLVPLEEIPDYMIQATIAIEDQNYYQHPGFSIRGITRAIKANLADEDLQGGSTITQQLIKNTLLTPERTWERKVKEIILSFTTEFYYSKDEILRCT